jgi:hypothetical protein
MGVTHQIVVDRLPVTLIKLAIVNHWRGEGQFLSEARILTPDRTQPIAVSQPAGFVIQPDGYADNVTFFINTTFFQPGNYVVQTLINSSLFSEGVLPVILVEQQSITQSERVN